VIKGLQPDPDILLHHRRKFPNAIFKTAKAHKMRGADCQRRRDLGVRSGRTRKDGRFRKKR
jgi:hypothetical protein